MKKTLFLSLTFFVVTLSLGTFTIKAQNLSRIDSLLNQKYPSNTPRASFLITKKGKIIYKKAFGLSNLELKTPLQTDNLFEIGSMNKQFTTVAILILAEQGKLNLEDDITKFIPEYPSKGNKITIHHLLTHTSGIKNFTSIKALSKITKKTYSDQIN